MFEYTPNELAKGLEDLGQPSFEFLGKLPTFLCSEIDRSTDYPTMIIRYGRVSNLEALAEWKHELADAVTQLLNGRTDAPDAQPPERHKNIIDEVDSVERFLAELQAHPPEDEDQTFYRGHEDVNPRKPAIFRERYFGLESSLLGHFIQLFKALGVLQDFSADAF